MELIKASYNDLSRVFAYWNKLCSDIPYFFRVSEERWSDCMINDSFMGKPIFKEIETYYALEGSEVLGFIQFGQPCFHFDSKGNLILMPHIGVIRNIYYEKDAEDVGEALIGAAEQYFGNKHFDEVYAFYHAMGMSCNARHGKLHESMAHIEAAIIKHGFTVEHENVYYSTNIRESYKDQVNRILLKPNEINQYSKQYFEATIDDKNVGGAEITYLDEATGGYTSDTVFLNWIGVEDEYKGQGIGSEILNELQRLLKDNGYTYLHLDTASSNIAAQKLYSRSGFTNRGITKSFYRK